MENLEKLKGLLYYIGDLEAEATGLDHEFHRIDIACGSNIFDLLGYRCAYSECHAIYEPTVKLAASALAEAYKCDCSECLEFVWDNKGKAK
jgi:hypothetical protein